MSVEEAEKLKNEGNEHFKEGKFHQAVDLYTKAIELNKTPTYLCNRAFAYLKIELPGAALADADEAIAIEPGFVKAYYRKASSHLQLGKFKDALKDFNTVLQLVPTDKDAKLKSDMCEKELRRIRFESAIKSKDGEPVSVTIQLGTLKADYTGPRIENDTLTAPFVEAMMEHFREEKKIDRRDVVFMLLEILKLFKTYPNFVSIDVPAAEEITVCGDTHGQFYDLLNIFQINGKPSTTNRYLFNGDFVDRGSYSVENVLTLFAYKLLYPNHVFLSRGNHEGIDMNRVYGFEGEVRAKYSAEVFNLFTEVFNALPSGHIINKKIFVVHGGVYSDDNMTIAELQKPNRFRGIPDKGPLCESLWADPQPMPGRTPSKRGVDCPEFGPDVTANFLKKNDLKLVVRSHEVKDNGYEVAHNGKCITVFSAPNYCDQMGNKGAFVRFKGGELEPHFTTFESVKHPGKRPMMYASGLGMC
ncbi:serine/threonine protein phosphatase type 5 [Strigomonas culicis]|uniref:Serine/threonine-protein phosphatase T n=1 Tax=Strigomonas culicis TaxID=28005 RepID=S9UAS0_9TRYP|nr:serine/threonine protein phosphatase type 5 [Strigomonas culicis]EPY26038.1 serine/threonine protein phosphatase type 5 [Strigomonas culicis]|eukprot:EPY23172.1 serine/threonine protein phosphatase type 5 [Strigomonas culicis]